MNVLCIKRRRERDKINMTGLLLKAFILFLHHEHLHWYMIYLLFVLFFYQVHRYRSKDRLVYGKQWWLQMKQPQRSYFDNQVDLQYYRQYYTISSLSMLSGLSRGSDFSTVTISQHLYVLSCLLSQDFVSLIIQTILYYVVTVDDVRIGRCLDFFYCDYLTTLIRAILLTIARLLSHQYSFSSIDIYSTLIIVNLLRLLFLIKYDLTIYFSQLTF